MTEFTIHDENTAPPEVAPALAQARKDFGFIPNLYGVMAESPQAFNAYQALSEQFRATSLPKDAQHVVWLTASRENLCTYCMAVHSAMAERSGVDPAVIEALRAGKPLDDHTLEAVRHFTQAAVAQQGNVADDDVRAFLAAGFTQRQILDIVVGVAMKTLSNYINHLAETPVDDAFAGHAWQA